MIPPQLSADAAPDYAEPLVAWRIWDVSGSAGEARLRSLFRVCTWPVREALVAECGTSRLWRWLRRGDHVAPHASCTCGIYATDCARLARVVNDGFQPTDWFAVIGTVSLWGRVVECERGWRASHAYPQRLYVPGRPGIAKPVARELRAYGVPVELLPGLTLAEALDELSAGAPL